VPNLELARRGEKLVEGEGLDEVVVGVGNGASDIHGQFEGSPIVVAKEVDELVVYAAVDMLPDAGRRRELTENFLVGEFLSALADKLDWSQAVRG
jgi:hypothetical protein